MGTDHSLDGDLSSSDRQAPDSKREFDIVCVREGQVGVSWRVPGRRTDFDSEFRIVEPGSTAGQFIVGEKGWVR